ncbi:HAD family hydrolase [Micromonospora fluostatini]|uniref:HAD family hydrolase n=1 Tax=Micromonospora sp. JCM 30529 TaxID=3421643 RepID=UPI003D176A57
MRNADLAAGWLVIFDCDGVLVETEPGETEAILMVARRYGYQMGLSDAVAAFRGRKLAEVQQLIERAIGAALPDRFIPEVRAACAATVDATVRASPGLPAVLAALGRPTCVASSSPPDVIERRLTTAGLIDAFRGRIYSAYDVNSWKPDPGLFRHAAAASGFPPQRCVVVEDSHVGVTAAIAAGMVPVAYDPAPGLRPGWPGAHRLRHLGDLPMLLDAVLPALESRTLDA